MSDDKVVFLKFSNEKVEPEGPEYMACTLCRNKTFVMLYEDDSRFPICQCAVCRNRIGYVGWAEQP